MGRGLFLFTLAADICGKIFLLTSRGSPGTKAWDHRRRKPALFWQIDRKKRKNPWIFLEDYDTVKLGAWISNRRETPCLRRGRWR